MVSALVAPSTCQSTNADVGSSASDRTSLMGTETRRTDVVARGFVARCLERQSVAEHCSATTLARAWPGSSASSDSASESAEGKSLSRYREYIADPKSPLTLAARDGASPSASSGPNDSMSKGRTTVAISTRDSIQT